MYIKYNRLCFCEVPYRVIKVENKISPTCCWDCRSAAIAASSAACAVTNSDSRNASVSEESAWRCRCSSIDIASNLTSSNAPTSFSFSRLRAPRGRRVSSPLLIAAVAPPECCPAAVVLIPASASGVSATVLRFGAKRWAVGSRMRCRNVEDRVRRISGVHPSTRCSIAATLAMTNLETPMSSSIGWPSRSHSASVT